MMFGWGPKHLYHGLRSRKQPVRRYWMYTYCGSRFSIRGITNSPTPCGHLELHATFGEVLPEMAQKDPRDEAEVQKRNRIAPAHKSYSWSRLQSSSETNYLQLIVHLPRFGLEKGARRGQTEKHGTWFYFPWKRDLQGTDQNWLKESLKLEQGWVIWQESISVEASTFLFACLE